jgi:Flp pilus assembly protein TadD
VAEGEEAFGAGDFSTAIQRFRAATATAPANATAWNNLAVVLHSIGDPATAEPAVDNALFVDPDDADALANRAAIAGARATAA